jgi:hypothetical protein
MMPLLIWLWKKLQMEKDFWNSKELISKLNLLNL